MSLFTNEKEVYLFLLCNKVYLESRLYFRDYNQYDPKFEYVKFFASIFWVLFHRFKINTSVKGERSQSLISFGTIIKRKVVCRHYNFFPILDLTLARPDAPSWRTLPRIIIMENAIKHRR